MIDKEAAMVKGIESRTVVRDYCRMKRRDWGIKIAKVKEVEEVLSVRSVQGRLEGSCIRVRT